MDDRSDRRPRRIFIECTWTHLTIRRAGIQRVVRNICARCDEVGRELGFECVPAVVDGKRFYAVKHAAPAKRSLPWRAMLHGRDLAAGLLYLAAGRRPGLAKAFKNRTASALLWAGRGRRIDWRAGDVLVLLDAGWNVDFGATLTEARAAGVRIVPVIYDLIPLTHPQFRSPKHAEHFASWLRGLCECADGFLTISSAVRGQILDHLRADATLSGGRVPPTEVFPLGCDIRPTREPRDDEVRPELRRAFDSGAGDAYLTVGWIEARKNHLGLVDAFDLVWRTHPDARLVIAGAKGRDSAPVVARVTGHPLFGKRLFLFHDLDDAELDWAYARATAVLMPSLAEGFGLPIVEALHRGAEVWANDMPVFREVGGEHCTYFDATRPEALARLVAERAAPGGDTARCRPGGFAWPDWTESCRALLRRAMDVTQGDDHA